MPTKRGAHLALSLERLEALVGKPLQRIGLSATQRPLEEVARFLGGVEVDSGRLPQPDADGAVLHLPNYFQTSSSGHELEANHEEFEEMVPRPDFAVTVVENLPNGRYATPIHPPFVFVL